MATGNSVREMLLKASRPTHIFLTLIAAIKFITLCTSVTLSFSQGYGLNKGSEKSEEDGKSELHIHLIFFVRNYEVVVGCWVFE